MQAEIRAAMTDEPPAARDEPTTAREDRAAEPVAELGTLAAAQPGACAGAGAAPGAAGVPSSGMPARSGP